MNIIIMRLLLLLLYGAHIVGRGSDLILSRSCKTQVFLGRWGMGKQHCDYTVLFLVAPMLTRLLRRRRSLFGAGCVGAARRPWALPTRDGHRRETVGTLAQVVDGDPPGSWPQPLVDC